MNSWYIDRSKNFINDTLDDALICIDECPSRDGPTVEGRLSSTGALGEAGGNPKAALTRFRDHGMLRMNNTIGDSARDYLNGVISVEELVIDLFIKRSAAKSTSTKVKPFVQLCQFFDYLISQGTDVADIFITFSECKEYLFPLDEYSKCTGNLSQRIVQERVYAPNAIYPTPRINLASNEKTNLSIWFNALKLTPIFSPYETDDRTILRPNILQSAFFKFISVNAEALYKLTSTNNDIIYSYYCDRRTGLNEIIPDVIRTDKTISNEQDARIVAEYLLGYKKIDGYDYYRFLRYPCFGLYFPLIALPGIIARKIALSNEKSGEMLQNFFRNNKAYIESWKYSDFEFDGVPNFAVQSYELYNKGSFLKDAFMDGDAYEDLVSLLMHKNNIILQGPPGVGKTFIAKRLAYSIIGEKAEPQVEVVQFHQNYSYEDFMQGYKPTDTGFSLKKGVFYSFCKKAQRHPELKYFFIIDEINRGNLSKIFGELLMLIEGDKRDKQIRLAYGDELFSVPKNVYLIGMMNTADRSIAFMDYALRRRFSFYNIEPAFNNISFKALLHQNLNEPVIEAAIVERLNELNNYIADESQSNLGPGFRIGHSYFCTKPIDGQSIEDWYRSIINFEIKGILSEYWWDEKDTAKQWVDRLIGDFNGGTTSNSN